MLLILGLFLAGCASKYPEFDIGSAQIVRFEADVAECKLLASEADAWADTQAERFESGSDAEILASVLASSLATNTLEIHYYSSCMKERGYDLRTKP